MSKMIRCTIKSADLSPAISKLDRMGKAARAAIVMAARRDSEVYVPMLTGALRQSANIESDPQSGLLVYGSASVVYAAPQYEAPAGWSYSMPGTGPAWFERAKTERLNSWIAEAKAAMKEVN